MIIIKAGAALDRQALALADDGIEEQVRIFARQNFDHIHAELVSAFEQKGEGEIRLAVFRRLVLRNGAADGIGHLLCGKAHNLPQCADALRDLRQFQFHSYNHPFYKINCSENKNQKSRPKYSLGRDLISKTRGTTQIQHFPGNLPGGNALQGSNKPLALTRPDEGAYSPEGFQTPAQE